MTKLHYPSRARFLLESQNYIALEKYPLPLSLTLAPMLFTLLLETRNNKSSGTLLLSLPELSK
jgi:hypothetical protein